jgi:hypothetical protein
MKNVNIQIEIGAFEWMPPITLPAKMDFSRQNLEQKRPVFLQYAQCSDSRETTHTWLGGRGLSWCHRSVGGRHHGDDKLPHRTWRLQNVSSTRFLCNLNWYQFWKRAILTNWYQFKMHIKLCRWDILQGADMSCLEKWASGPQKPNTRWNLESFVPTTPEQVVWLEDELAVMTMGSKDCCLSNFTLFKLFWYIVQ